MTPAGSLPLEEIWVFRVGSLGDALVALPAVHRLRALHPNARLVLLTNRSRPGVVNAWDVLQHAGVFDECIPYQPGHPSSAVHLLLQLRARKPRKLVYLAPHRSAAQTRRDAFFFHTLGGVPEILGLSSAQKLRCHSGRELSRGALPKESERLLHVVDEGAALADVCSKPLLCVPLEAHESAKALLGTNSMPRSNANVVMVPGSKMQAKRWPVERFVTVGQALLQQDERVRIILLGSSDEAELCSHVQSALGDRATNLAGQTTIMQAAALLDGAAMYLGNDTGTMHLAAAVGLPGVAVFSARDAVGKWEPFGQNYVVIRQSVSCEGCMLESCIDEDIRCLREISAKRVEDASLTMMRKRLSESMEQS